MVEKNNSGWWIFAIIISLLLFNIFFEVKFVDEPTLISRRIHGENFWNPVFNEYYMENKPISYTCTPGVTLEYPWSYPNEVWIKGVGYCEVIMYETYTKFHIGLR